MATKGTPLFSVIIPVYNRAGPLARALKSVLAQTCKDFEIIVIDDGSSDNTKHVVDSFADPRIHFFEQENKGASAARNAGIDLARGNYVAFLDSDDVFLPHHLVSMKYLLAGQSNAAGFARIVVDRGNGNCLVKPPRAPRTGEDIATYLLCDRGFIPTITLVVPHKIAASVRYDENVVQGDDKDFAIRLAATGCKFLMLKKPGAIWRDSFNPHRLSARHDAIELGRWRKKLRLIVSARAYFGFCGWTLAKAIAATDKQAAFKLYLSALRHRCYPPGWAIVILLQIFLPTWLYRSIVDCVSGTGKFAAGRS